ncbi:TPA: hypothetical protein ACGO2R_001854 [Streptococcus suis]
MWLFKLKGEAANLLFILVILILLLAVVTDNAGKWSAGASVIVALCLLLIAGLGWRSLRRIGQNHRILAGFLEEYPLLKGSKKDFLAQLDYYDKQMQLAYHGHYLISFFESIQVVDLNDTKNLTYHYYDWKQRRGGSWREHYLEVARIHSQQSLQVHFAQIAHGRLHRLVKFAFPNAKADYSDNLAALYQAYKSKYPELVIDVEKETASDEKARREKV